MCSLYCLRGKQLENLRFVPTCSKSEVIMEPKSDGTGCGGRSWQAVSLPQCVIFTLFTQPTVLAYI